jgi:hypothetical protein
VIEDEEDAPVHVTNDSRDDEIPLEKRMISEEEEKQHAKATAAAEATAQAQTQDTEESELEVKYVGEFKE